MLTTLLDEPAPASTVDLAVAASAGRRIRRRRTAMSTLAASAATVLTVVVVSALTWAAPTRPATVSGSRPSSAPSSSAGPTSAPSAPPVDPAALTGTDPVRLTARFGWLPAGAVITDRNWGAMGDEQMAEIGSKPSGAGIDLNVLPGGEPGLGYLPGGAPATRIPAADVNGAQAYWLVRPRAGAATADQDVTLRWQFAAGKWATLEITGLASPDDFTTLVYRIADSVTFGHDDPVPLPFHITTLPAGLKVVSGGHQLASAEFGAVSTSLDYVWSALLQGSAGLDGTWEIDTEPYLPAVPLPPGATGVQTLKVDGHYARLSNTGLVVYDVNGMTVALSASKAALDDVNASGGYTAWFNRLVLLGPDESKWTTHVIG